MNTIKTARIPEHLTWQFHAQQSARWAIQWIRRGDVIRARWDARRAAQAYFRHLAGEVIEE